MATEADVAERLVYDYGGRLYGFCLKLVGKRTDADDLYQQVFLKILEIPAKIDLNNNPSGFLMAVAVRIWRDEQRKFARRNRIAPVSYGEEFATVPDKSLDSAEIEKRQLQEDIHCAIGNLSDTLRIPVLLYYMGELSVKEIGFDEIIYNALNNEELPSDSLQVNTIRKIHSHTVKNKIPWLLFAICGSMQALSIFLMCIIVLPYSIFTNLILTTGMLIGSSLIICSFILSRIGSRKEKEGEYLWV